MVTVLPLRLTGATLARRGRTLVGPIDLTLAAGGTTVVIGPNGSGKTSLLRLMHGLQRPAAGRVEWALPDASARTRQSYVFQQPVALRRSVLENLAFPLRLRGVPRARARAAAEDAARRVGLDDRLSQSAPSLSGGEMQRLALARALITDPEILFADEPCAALDGAATRRIEGMLLSAAATTRIVMATHDMGQARRLAREVIFLLHGRIHESGPADAFFDAPRTLEARAFLNGDILE
ncbi:ATP-binding cassette domain-containing protein [Jannaschia rubra]|uniref:Phosphate import ATP-binding protein PstB n=1 Tax=Jannaschia rubra TaxID=282197 RepID=A0A0M6XRD4_9RHOB|nr:ATP-binding cassette domain-containing protein [Jannaschia rubra]CTQ33187.1 Phosphate import ATP-binding protein PstB [Jannaschia rubra]SFF96517.1 phosphate ABC transporter ATP-binding protein, PhoT family (TC 3.A.1.7.1) [Jannaschia rubra]